MVIVSNYSYNITATYRVQLRNGVSLDDALALLPALGALGVSHLYLSPLFRAATGSTHGYDVIDPNEVDPVLGGEEAFIRLSDAARIAGIGVVLDIVPNHMACVPENPLLYELMKGGRDSASSEIFDIDWNKGSLHFPVLNGTPDEVLAAGQIAMGRWGDDTVLEVYGQSYPLADTPLSRELAERGELDASALADLLAEQCWSIGDWRQSAQSINHRRFFNISSLIGVRQENIGVFRLTHRWISRQVEAGRIQGLRVDHVDGLARPGGYLAHLRELVGPDVPVWVEKIAKEDEEIPDWPVQGMSGYEFMTPVTQFLTQPDGLAAMRAAARHAVPEDMANEVRSVRQALLHGTFVPEHARVVDAAMAALGCAEALRGAVEQAVDALALVWPVYRSYTADGLPLSPEFAGLRSAGGMAGALLDLLQAAAGDPQARQFAARFEQLTGALTAKSEEDTVFFRAVSYLPFCEVGAEPELQTISRSAFEALMNRRAARTPYGLNALSTHDTKRSADARATIVALSYFPALASRFYAHAGECASACGLAPRWGIYALQTALAMREEPDAQARLMQHMTKAAREAKDLSSYENPDEGAERKLGALAAGLLEELAGDGIWSGKEEASFHEVLDAVILAQVALQITAPGIPDIYQGTEWVSANLTDPDNRRAVDRRAEHAAGSLPERKFSLTARLLALRKSAPELFARGSYELRAAEREWIVRRTWQGQSAEVPVPRPLPPD